MPTYVYECDTCNTVWEESLSYENRDKPIENGCTATSPCDGNIRRVPVMPLFAYDNVGPGKKPDSSFNDKLKEIKKTHYGSKMNIIE